MCVCVRAHGGTLLGGAKKSIAFLSGIFSGAFLGVSYFFGHHWFRFWATSVISNNLAKNGDVIKYKGNEALTQDEKMTPMLEDIILLDVIREIDGRLPAFVKTHYNHKMKKDERLMETRLCERKPQ